MKNIQSILIIIALLITTGIQAQQKGLTTEDKAKTETARAKKYLGLSDSQAAQYETVVLKYGKKVEKLKSNKLAAQDRSRQITEINTAKKDEIRQILTPAQWEKYSNWNKERVKSNKAMVRRP